jgi:hypothetical protein
LLKLQTHLRPESDSAEHLFEKGCRIRSYLSLHHPSRNKLYQQSLKLDRLPETTALHIAQSWLFLQSFLLTFHTSISTHSSGGGQLLSAGTIKAKSALQLCIVSPLLPVSDTTTLADL